MKKIEKTYPELVEYFNNLDAKGQWNFVIKNPTVVKYMGVDEDMVGVLFVNQPENTNSHHFKSGGGHYPLEYILPILGLPYTRI